MCVCVCVCGSVCVFVCVCVSWLFRAYERSPRLTGTWWLWKKKRSVDCFVVVFFCSRLICGRFWSCSCSGGFVRNFLKNSEIILEDFSWRCRGVVVVVFVGVVVCKGRVFPVGGGRITFLRIPELRSHDDFCVEGA